MHTHTHAFGHRKYWWSHQVYNAIAAYYAPGWVGALTPPSLLYLQTTHTNTVANFALYPLTTHIAVKGLSAFVTVIGHSALCVMAYCAVGAVSAFCLWMSGAGPPWLSCCWGSSYTTFSNSVTGEFPACSRKVVLSRAEQRPRGQTCW